jgi:hypothetical protein
MAASMPKTAVRGCDIKAFAGALAFAGDLDIRRPKHPFAGPDPGAFVLTQCLRWKTGIHFSGTCAKYGNPPVQLKKSRQPIPVFRAKADFLL